MPWTQKLLQWWLVIGGSNFVSEGYKTASI